MEFRVLGPLEVSDDGRKVALGGPKPRALLAILLLRHGKVVPADELIEQLYDGLPPKKAANSVQAQVSRLRNSLGDDRLRTAGHGYALDVLPGEFDLDVFEELVERGRGEMAAKDPVKAASSFREALALWRGPPLADFRYRDFAQGAIARLEERRLVALEDRIDADLALGRHPDLVSELESLVAEFPLREQPRALLMLALYRSGRQAEALATYQDARRLLVEELGIEPSAELRDLHRAILNQDASLAAPARTLEDERLPSLPAPANRLIGRKDDLRALNDLLLGEARLVTVTGAGGSGKTRLALEVARALETEFGPRVYFVPLAPLRQPELLAMTILAALALKEMPGEQPLETLKRTLSGDSLLLVLDNFEHLLDSAPLVSEVLTACPRLRILATSRAALHLSGEHEYSLEPLPSKQALALFSERAKAVRKEFAADESVLAAICARLDCLPLTLELAAARSRVLTPEELLSRLEHSLEFLTGGPRDVAARQQTLRATIEWSYSLLDSDEQQLFARLAIFAGGCTFEAAESVCDASLEQLESLVYNSLLRRRETGAETRFWMLETIREFALEKLESSGGAEDGRRTHARYYLALAQRWAPDLGLGRHGTIDALEDELNNFRAALSWALETDTKLALRLAVALSASWYARLQLVEGRRWFEAVLKGQQAPSRERAVILAELARVQLFLDEHQQAFHSVEQALEFAERLGLPDILSEGLNTKALLFDAAGRHGEALALLEEALAIAREQDHPRPLLRALANLSRLLISEDRQPGALALDVEGLELARQVRSSSYEHAFLSFALECHLDIGEWDQALALADEIERAPRRWRRPSPLPTLYAWRGELDKAWRALEVESDVAAGEDVELRASHALDQAIVLQAEGRFEEALAAAKNAFAARAVIGERDALVRTAFVVAVESAFGLEDLVQVNELLGWCEQLSASERLPSLEAQKARFAGLLAAHDGIQDAVDSGLAQAAAMFRKLPMPFYVAVTLLEHGEWLVAQSRADDAEPLLDEAHEIFTRLGAKPWLQRTEQAQAKDALL